MMQVSTKPFGTIEINPIQVVQFPNGLLGFNDEKEFAILDDKEQSPFKWLQSTKDPALAFILIQPELFLKNEYIPDVSESDLKALEVETVSDCIIFLIVTIPQSQPEKMTANLQGPVLINKEKNMGRQIISNNDDHLVRVAIMDEMGG